MKKELQIWWTFIKSFFVCQHFSSDLSVDRLLVRLPEEEECNEFQHWNCECTCKCGEKVEQVFALNAGYLGDPRERYPMKSEFADETYL